MATPSTVATYALNNSTRDFDVTFDYLSQTFVQVSLIGETAQVLTLGSDYTFLSPTVIRTTLTYGPPDWSYIEVRRVTSTTERLVEFNDASILQASDLNLSDIQVLHVAEEARNSATETIGVNNEGNLDARGRRLVNVADPVDLGDAITIRWYQGQLDGAHADRVAAEAAKVSSEAAAAAALLSQNAAANSATAAGTSAGNAANSATAAGVSAGNAASSATASSDSANLARSYRDTAESHKNAAAASAGAANLSATNAAASAAAAQDSAASINDANLVHKTGTETVTGLKTFSALFTASAGAVVSNGELSSYGFGGNTAAGRVYLNSAKTAYIGSDGTNVNIMAPGGNKVSIPYLLIPAANGEGGEMQFGVSANSTLVGGVVVDVNDYNSFRIFETAGTNRGVTLNLGEAPAGTVAHFTHSHIAGDKIGQLVWAQQVAGSLTAFNGTTAGSNLRVACGGQVSGVALSGTWRCLGAPTTVSSGFNSQACSLWIKIA